MNPVHDTLTIASTSPGSIRAADSARRARSMPALRAISAYRSFWF
jgi:hypothetical protein